MYYCFTPACRQATQAGFTPTSISIFTLTYISCGNLYFSFSNRPKSHEKRTKSVAASSSKFFTSFVIALPLLSVVHRVPTHLSITHKICASYSFFPPLYCSLFHCTAYYYLIYIFPTNEKRSVPASHPKRRPKGGQS